MEGKYAGNAKLAGCRERSHRTNQGVRVNYIRAEAAELAGEDWYRRLYREFGKLS